MRQSSRGDRAHRGDVSPGEDRLRFRRVDGYLFLAPEHDAKSWIRSRSGAGSGRPGARSSRVRDVSGFESGPCLRFPRQGQFHPLQLPERDSRQAFVASRRTHLHGHAERSASTGGRRASVQLEDGFTVTRRIRSWSRPTRRSTTGSPSTRSRRRTTPTSSRRACRPTRSRRHSTGTPRDPYHYVRLQRVTNDELGRRQR